MASEKPNYCSPNKKIFILFFDKDEGGGHRLGGVSDKTFKYLCSKMSGFSEAGVLL